MLDTARLIYLVLYVRDIAVSRDFYEGVLGFRVLEEDEASVKYSAGHVVICLNRASDLGIQLPEGRDRSIDITFLVDDFHRMYAALQARGVRFSRTLEYIVGTTVDFYDPDGHWFSLYQPSETVMSWPSADKIRALRLAAGSNGAELNGGPLPGNGTVSTTIDTGLDGHELVYLFLFVQDPDSTLKFYNDVLGLTAIEGGPCRRVVTSAPLGVVKYDAGGTLLTTHHVEGEHAAKLRVATEGSSGVALAFHVMDVRAATAELSRRGVRFTEGPSISRVGMVGTLARFEDPAGHVYYLYEPSSEALARPSGSAMQRILAAPL
jgi:catechol 2,3-dioxygenase-like lactoylglutathione lyase family enzyme